MCMCCIPIIPVFCQTGGHEEFKELEGSSTTDKDESGVCDGSPD